MCRLLRGHYSPFLALTDSCANPMWLSSTSAFGLVRGVFAGCYQPCCYRDSPDVISANLSPDAWSPTPTVPPSALACFFLGVIGLPKTLYRSASRWYPRTRFFRGLVLEVADISLCSGLRVCSPPRSLLPLRIFPQGSRGFYIRANRASLPPHAPDMLSVRIQRIDRKRTSTFLDLLPCRPLRVPH